MHILVLEDERMLYEDINNGLLLYNELILMNAWKNRTSMNANGRTSTDINASTRNITRDPAYQNMNISNAILVLMVTRMHNGSN